MPTEKQRRSKEAWDILKPFVNVDGSAEYMAARREVDKLSENPMFIKKVQQIRKEQEMGITEFLLKGNMGPCPKLVRFLNTDMSEFFKPRRRKR